MEMCQAHCGVPIDLTDNHFEVGSEKFMHPDCYENYRKTSLCAWCSHFCDQYGKNAEVYKGKLYHLACLDMAEKGEQLTFVFTRRMPATTYQEALFPA